MSSPESSPDHPPDNLPLEQLIARFREAEAALQNALDDGVDAVLDPVTATPILLHNTQADLQASDARYRRLLSGNTVVVFELDADGTTLFVNDTIFDMLGYTPQELLGRNWWDTLLQGDQRQQRDDLYRQFQTGDVTQYEFALTSKQGETLIVDLNTFNRRKPDGSPDRILGLGVGITERRKTENELKANYAYLEELSAARLAKVTKANTALQHLADMREQLLLIERAALAESEQANQMKIQFLATISHELRTPLTSIKGFASLLLAKDERQDAATQRESIAIIDEEADKLVDLIAQLIDSAGLQAGTLRIQPELCSLTAIIGTAKTQLQTVTVEHQFIIDVPLNLPPIMADEQRIAQVLVNLVGNAVKFSPSGTRITLSATPHATMLQIDVSDEGSGIAVENREKVFETFWQPKEPNAGNLKGLGLGLAICKGIITAHGGNIWVGEVSVGTTMSFTLPLAALPNVE